MIPLAKGQVRGDRGAENSDGRGYSAALRLASCSAQEGERRVRWRTDHLIGGV